MIMVMVWLLALLVVVMVICKARQVKTRGQDASWYVPGFDWLKDSTRSMGVLVIGGKGSGKSFSVGRDLCFRTFMDGIAQIIIEPTGGLTDPLLQKLLEETEKMPADQQEAVWKRIWYVDMAAQDRFVVSWPLYMPLENESLYDSVQPLIETFLSLDPELKKAPVEGENALRTLGTYVGMILVALRFQISEAVSLLEDPKQWKNDGWLDEAVKRNPEAAEAVAWFKEQYCTWKDEMRARRTSAWRNKTGVFSLNPVQRAIYGGSQGIDFDRLKQEKITLIVDFRHVLNEERLRFGMQWLFQWFLMQIRYRDLRSEPIHLCMDEITRMIKVRREGDPTQIELDLQSLVNVEARNRGVFYTLMLQGLWQVGEYMQDTLLSCGNYVVGYLSDEHGARKLASKVFPYTGRPLVKRWEKIYSHTPNGPVLTNMRPVEYTLVEAECLAANAFTRQPGFHFIVRAAEEEGTVTGPVLPMVVKEVGKWVDKERVAALRRKLVRKTGRPLDEVLAEIDQRLQHKPGDESAILSSDGPDSDLPTQPEPKEEGEGVIWERAEKD